MSEFPDEFNGKTPYYNGFENKNDPAAVEYVRIMNEVHRQLAAGELYIKFIDGDRAGSIAKVFADTERFRNRATGTPEITYRQAFHNDKNIYRIDGDRCYGICRWDGRNNKVQISLPHREAVFLLNYNGPTVWSKFDIKTAKEEALKTPNQTDIDGTVLSVGDEVLYINARYGSGMELCYGKIKEFKAKGDSKRIEISTIVEEIDTGVLSEINNSALMIWKKK